MFRASAIIHLHDRDWVFVPEGNGAIPPSLRVTGGKMTGQRSGGYCRSSRPGRQVVANALELNAESDAVAERISKKESIMIRAFVDYSLRNKLSGADCRHFCCSPGEPFSFKNLPVEAYPDVANNYVQIITQWPGRAGEEVEQQVTIPIEVQMAGIPHLSNIRSISEFGLSVVTMIFDDDSINDWNRQKVLERISGVNAAEQSAADDRARLQPRRTAVLVHPEEHQSAVRLDGAEVASGLGA